MPPADPESSRWFDEQVQPHVPMLRAWLQSRFGPTCEVDDILQEAFLRVLQELSNKEIARALGKSECTVKNQVSSILAKTGVPTRARLMALLR